MQRPLGLELLYSPEENHPAVADIIFVHGLGGHRRDTWTKTLSEDELSPPPPPIPIRPERTRDRLRSLFNTKPSPEIRTTTHTQVEAPDVENGDNSNKVFWPLDLLPGCLPDCRIYTWGYSVDISGGSTTTVFQHAKNLLSSVADTRMSTADRHRPIVWVAHSLGGIVVKDALNQSRSTPTYLKDILPVTYGVCFLGTPHRGSSVAALGDTVYGITRLWGGSPSLQIIRALRYDAETLDRIQSQFKETLDLCKSQSRRICIRSFCEANKTHGMLVVDHFSSMIDDVDEIVTDVAANHSQISKFASSTDPGYMDVSSALQRWVTEIREHSLKHYELLEELKKDYIRSLENRQRGMRVRQVEKNYDHTYTWLFSDIVPFQDWLRGAAPWKQESIFWIEGKPGSGKSTLMKYALSHRETEKLLQESHQGRWTLVPFFFSDRGSSIQKTVDGLLQELLYKILCAYKDLTELVMSISLRSIPSEFSTTRFRFDDRDPKRVIWSRESIQDAREIIKNDTEPGGPRRIYTPEIVREALIAIVQQSEIPMNILFFIDALDEHQGSHEELVNILRSLSSPQDPATIRIKLCLASRPESIFPGAFHKCPGFAVQGYTRSDIGQYVFGRINSTFNLLVPSEDDRKQVKPLCDEVLERAKGVFVWVKLVVDELIEGLNDGNNISQLRRTLDSIPTELDALYKRIIQKRKPEHLLEMYIMSQILLCSPDPVSLDSLIAITDVSLSDDALETMSVSWMQQRLGSRCGGLIEVYELTVNKDVEDEYEEDEEDWVEEDEDEDNEYEDKNPNGKYIAILINDELPDTQKKSDKVYRVQFLHQTVKSFLENPETIDNMFKKPVQAILENGWSYILNFCVKAVTQMKFNQALAHRTIIQGLFNCARELEQCQKIDSAGLLDLLLVERKGWFTEGFDTRLCTKEQMPIMWGGCIHDMPHERLRSDGLNLWQICVYEGDADWLSEEYKGTKGFSLLRCSVLPINFSSRQFDLLFLAAFQGLAYYVKRKVLGGASLVCPRTSRSLLWATIDGCLRSTAGSYVAKLEILDLIIERSANVDLVFGRLTPLGHMIRLESYNDNGALWEGQPILLVIMRKLLCSGADAHTPITIRGDVALLYIVAMDDSSYSPETRAGAVELLLQHGANPRSFDREGFQPLFWTIVWSNGLSMMHLIRYGADSSNVGNSISAMEPSTNVKPDFIARGWRSNWGHEIWNTFQRNAAEMHDLLVRCENLARTAPLCQCKQQQYNSTPETQLAYRSKKEPSPDSADAGAYN